MRTNDASLRLEAHRLKWIRNGRRGALLPFHGLNESEKQFFIDELTRDVSARRLNVGVRTDEKIFDFLFLQILNEWGVMCPHPATSVIKTAHGYFCYVCSCDVVVPS